MAILDKFTVQLMVDGQPAQEYDDDDEPDPMKPNEITQYVQAVSGKQFKLKVYLAPNYKFRDENLITANVWMDGKWAGGVCYPKEEFSNFYGGILTIDGYHTGQGDHAKRLQYAFADLETRDMDKHDDVATMREKYADLGTITIKLRRCVFSGYSDNHSEREVPTLGAVPEKALKGRPLDLATTFKAKASTRPRSWKTQALDENPIAEFHFKYRTRKALQYLLIIDRSPSPVPLEERPIETLSHQEALERLRRQETNGAVKQENKSAKRERSESNALPPRPLKTSKGSQGETVYHIDSDEEEEAQLTGKTSGSANRGSSPADEEIEVVTL